MAVRVKNIQPEGRGVCDIYVRVSTDEQDTGDKISIPDQIEYCTDQAGKRGLRVGKVWKDIDSGAKRNRVDMLNCMDRVRGGLVEAVLVKKADRWFRQTRGCLAMLDDFTALNIGLIALQEGVDSRDPWGYDQWFMMMKMAEGYRASFFDNSMNARLRRAEKGILADAAGSGRVWGYDYHKSTKDAPGYFTVNEAIRPYVIDVFRWSHDDGMSNIAIARELNRRGVDAPRGKVWYDTTVRDVLRNTAYLGPYSTFRNRPDQTSLSEFPLSGWARHWAEPDRQPVTIENAFPPILDTPELAALAEGYDARAATRKRQSPRNRKHDYFLTGLVVCDVCGHICQGVTEPREYKDGTPYLYTYYRCRRRECKTFIHMDQADEKAWSLVCEVLGDEKKLAAMIDTVRGDDHADAVHADIERIEGAMGTLERKVSETNDFLKRPDLRAFERRDEEEKRESYLTQYDALTVDLEAARAQLDAIGISASVEKDVLTAARMIRDRLPTATDPLWKRAVLEQLGVRFRVRHTGRKQHRMWLSFGNDVAVRGGSDLTDTVLGSCSTAPDSVHISPDTFAPFRSLPRLTYPTA